MWRTFQDEIETRVSNHPKVQQVLPELKDAIQKGVISPTAAADRLTNAFFSPPGV